MPITNLFFHTIPNPFHSKHRKTLSTAPLHNPSRHERSTGTASASLAYSTNSPDVASPTSPLKHKRFSFDRWKVRRESSTASMLDKGKQRKSFSNKPLPASDLLYSNSITENLTDPTVATEVGSNGNGNNSSSNQDDHDSSSSSSMPVLLLDLRTPTSASFGASPLSPQMCFPSSPPTPFSPATPHGRDVLTASPEPITPPVSKSPSTTQLHQSPNHGGPGLGVASRLGSFFSNKADPEPDVVDAVYPDAGLSAPLPRKKRLSANSLQLAAPIGAFLSNTFRPKHSSSSLAQEQTKEAAPMPNEQGMPGGGQEHGDFLHLPQHPQEQEQQQQQPLQKRKKRKSLLPKLPRLDTRPRILISGPKVDQPKKSKLTPAPAPPPTSLSNEDCPTPEPRSPSTPLFLRPRALLSPFHLPSKARSKLSKMRHHQLRTEGQYGGKHGDGVPIDVPQLNPGSVRDGEDSYPTQKDTDRRDLNEDQSLEPGANLSDWRQYSEPYYDERWDRASILTVDSDWVKLSDDPSFPGYPERNDYWQKHCHVRERRRKKPQRLSMARVPSFSNRPPSTLMTMTNAPVPAPDNEQVSATEKEMDLESGDGTTIDDRPQEDDQFSDITDLQPSLLDMTEFTETDLSRRSSRASNTTTSTIRGRGTRVRYSSYSAYIAAMKQEPNQTDRKRALDEQSRISRNNSDSSLPRVSSRLLEDMRRLKERSMAQQEITPQQNFVQAMADRFETPHLAETTASDSDSTLARNSFSNGPKEISWRKPSQGHRHKHSQDGVNLGSSDEEEQGLENDLTVTKAMGLSEDRTLRQRRQPNSGILFVSAETAKPELTAVTTMSQDPMVMMMMLEGASNTPTTTTMAAAKSTLDKQDSSSDAVQSSSNSINIKGEAVVVEEANGLGTGAGARPGVRAGSLVSSRLSEREVGGRRSTDSGVGGGGSGYWRGNVQGVGQGKGDEAAGKGNLVVASSFGHQGYCKKLNNAPNLISHWSPGAHSDPSDACSSASLHDGCDQSRGSGGSSPNKASFDKSDLLVCRPGQYASQNHIMPLDKLLLQEERQRLERLRLQGENRPLERMRQDDALGQSSSHSEVVSEATAQEECEQKESHQEDPEAPHVLAAAAIVESPKTPRSSGHMLVMVRNGKFQYYINGARNDSFASEEDDDNEDVDEYSDEEESVLESGVAHYQRSFHRLSTSIIQEEDEETDEEDLRDQRRTSVLSIDTNFVPSRAGSLRRPYRGSFYGARWKGKAIDRSELGRPGTPSSINEAYPESEQTTYPQENEFAYDRALAGPSSLEKAPVEEMDETQVMTANSSESHFLEDVSKEPPSRRASVASVPVMQLSSSSRHLLVTPPSTVTVSRSSSLAIPSSSMDPADSASSSLAAAAASLVSPPSSTPSSPSRHPISRSQSRILGTKSRPSISCSCHPTLAQPASTSYTSLVAITSTPSTTSLSSAQLAVAAATALSTTPATASLRRRESGSSWLSGGGPGSVSGYDTPESPSSPTAAGTFSWPETAASPNPAEAANSVAAGGSPVSASVLLDSILSRPMRTPYLLQDSQRKQSMQPYRTQSTSVLPSLRTHHPSTSSTTVTTIGSTSSTPWIRRPLLRSASTVGTSTTSSHFNQNNRVGGGGSSLKSNVGSGSGWSSPRSPPSSRPSSPLSSPRRQTMLDIDEIVADLEMAQELALRQDDDPIDDDHDATATHNSNSNNNDNNNNKTNDNNDEHGTNNINGDKNIPNQSDPNDGQQTSQEEDSTRTNNAFNRWGAAIHSSLVGAVMNSLIRSTSGLSSNDSSSSTKAVPTINTTGDHTRRASQGDRDRVMVVSTLPRKRTRALSMVELSASTPTSKFQSTTATTATPNRARYKAEPSISTSTMETLHSGKDMYQWSDFFDM